MSVPHPSSAASCHHGSCWPHQPHVSLSWERVFALWGVPVPSTRVTLLSNFLLETHLESLVNYWLEDSPARPWYL